MSTALVVGGFGGLGTAITQELARDGRSVLRSSRAVRDEPGAVVLGDGPLPALPQLDAVVWAHGVNVNDSVLTADTLGEVLETNVELVARQMRELVDGGLVGPGARFVVVSSIWELVARRGKFSYTVSKAAVGGLVRAAALDLAPQGILVNGVLPGVVDTAMTRAMLSADQVAAVEAATPAGRMVTATDVARTVAFLASERCSGLTGQSLVVDLGYSVGRVL